MTRPNNRATPRGEKAGAEEKEEHDKEAMPTEMCPCIIGGIRCDDSNFTTRSSKNERVTLC